MDGKGAFVTSARGIQDVSTGPARSPGTASAMRDGVACSATKISITARTISHADMAGHASTLDRVPTHAAVPRGLQEPTARGN